MEDLRSGIEHLKQAKAHMSDANGIMNGHISKLKALEEENAELKAELASQETMPWTLAMNATRGFVKPSRNARRTVSMSVIKHPDTYVCDICGAEFTERRPVNVPVVWTTEQTEGRFCEPYYGVECLDLCEECADRVHVVEVAGAQGRNSYVFRKAVGE